MIKKFQQVDHSIWSRRSRLIGPVVIILTLLPLYAGRFNMGVIPSRDSMKYVQLAKEWHACGENPPSMDLEKGNLCPGYVFLLHFFVRNNGNLIHTAVILNTLCAGISAVLIISICRQLRFSETISFSAGMFYVLNPVICGLAMQVQREILYLLFTIAGIAFFTRAFIKSAYPAALLSGLCLGISVWFRLEGLETIFYLMICAFILIFVVKKISLPVGILLVSSMSISFLTSLFLFGYGIGYPFNFIIRNLLYRL